MREHQSAVPGRRTTRCWLEAMRRGYTSRAVPRELVEPGTPRPSPALAVTTDLIVGFPGRRPQAQFERSAGDGPPGHPVRQGAHRQPTRPRPNTIAHRRMQPDDVSVGREEDAATQAVEELQQAIASRNKCQGYLEHDSEEVLVEGRQKGRVAGKDAHRQAGVHRQRRGPLSRRRPVNVTKSREDDALVADSRQSCWSQRSTAGDLAGSPGIANGVSTAGGVAGTMDEMDESTRDADAHSTGVPEKPIAGNRALLMTTRLLAATPLLPVTEYEHGELCRTDEGLDAQPLAKEMAAHYPVAADSRGVHAPRRQGAGRARLAKHGRSLGRKVVILGHHYQREEVIKYADLQGDSFKLSQQRRRSGGGRLHSSSAACTSWPRAPTCLAALTRKSSCPTSPRAARWPTWRPPRTSLPAGISSRPSRASPAPSHRRPT